MKRYPCARAFRRLTASVVLVAYLASCTHMPSGQKAFDSFDQCIAANLGLATAGGFAIGALGKSLAKQMTGDRSTQNVVAVSAGVAAAVMIGMTAWRKCAAVYSTSEPIAQPASEQPPPAAVRRRKSGLSMDRLEVNVEGTENDPPVPEFDFTYQAEDAAAKDIKARFRHKVEIVRFKADDHDKLILADAKGETLHDSAGNPIPLEAAMRMPRERLHWVTVAEEGHDDYIEDVIIQQGHRASYRHKLQIPPRTQLPLPLPVPMRYTVTVEVDRFKSARTVDFALLGTVDRPRRFVAAAAAGPGDREPDVPQPASVSAAVPPRTEEQKAAPAATPRAGVPAAVPKKEERKASVAPTPRASVSTAQAPSAEEHKAAPSADVNFVATHTLRRDALIQDEASTNRKTIGRLSKDTPVRIEEPAGFDVTNRPRVWVRVVTRNGTSGWLQAGELEEIR